MTLLKIIKLSNKTWKHNSDVDGDFILTKFYAKQEDNEFLLIETYGAKRRKYLIAEIEVYDIGGTAETFSNFDDLFLRLEALKYPAFFTDGEVAGVTSVTGTMVDNTNPATPIVNSDDTKLDKVSTAGVERAYIINADGSQGTKATSEIGTTQNYFTFSTNTSLTDSHHNAVIWVTATINITIPSGLRSDFNCTFRTLTGAIATFLTSGTTINAESDGDVQAAKTMSFLAQYTTNDYIISGGGLS